MTPQHISILRHELEARTRRNPGYSLRAFARDLRLSAAALSSFLNQKKGMSEERARKVAARIELSQKEAEVFVLSAISNHARSAKERTLAKQKLTRQQKEKPRVVDSADFEQVQNWYHLAILELIELDECQHTPEWLAKKLGIGIQAVKFALDRLTRVGLLSFANGRYKALANESVTEMDVPSRAIRTYHSEILTRADRALYRDSVQEREFLGMTLAFAQTDLVEAKEAIREFQKQFAERFYSEEKKKNSVYQLSVQFFRLDQKEDQS